MRYYQEITLIDQAEISPYFIWSKLYGQLHLALVDATGEGEQVGIGVSFPQYIYEKASSKKPKVNLGNKLRLFASSEEDLQKLNIKHWLERLLDYVHIGPIRPVPENKVTGYVHFARKQVKTNADRLARHRAKRGDISFDEAKARYQNVVTTTDLPFVQMKSLTSEQPFKLFIEKRLGKKTAAAAFSAYGLSAICTVPEFI